MDSVRIRNYKKDDYTSVREILIEGGLFEETWDVEERLGKRVIARPESILIAMINDEVIGCVYLIDDIFPLIFRLAVKKQFRKQGIGKMLIDEAIKRLKEYGHQEIALLVDNNDEELKKWYHKQGFKKGTELICLWKEI